MTQNRSVQTNIFAAGYFIYISNNKTTKQGSQTAV